MSYTIDKTWKTFRWEGKHPIRVNVMPTEAKQEVQPGECIKVHPSVFPTMNIYSFVEVKEEPKKEKPTEVVEEKKTRGRSKK